MNKESKNCNINARNYRDYWDPNNTMKRMNYKYNIAFNPTTYYPGITSMAFTGPIENKLPYCKSTGSEPRFLPNTNTKPDFIPFPSHGGTKKYWHNKNIKTRRLRIQLF
jgi:hypothetical protein